MNSYLIVFALSIINLCVNSFKNETGATVYSPSKETKHSVCTKINSLNTLIRDNKINKPAAKDSIRALFSALNILDFNAVENSYIFPIVGYNKANIGGKNGNGYVVGNYNYFNGNKHTGHPAHDILIFDKNQDGKDDKTNKEVYVVAFTKGIVVAMEDRWDTTSTLRGGRYIWLYNNVDSTLTYYAHNNKILVKTGDEVSSGDTIATIGRTGFNAHKKRSPTHLHFMQLKFDTKMFPKPINPFKKLMATN